MPIGIIVNVCAVCIGGILGSVLKDHIKPDFTEKLNLIFGLCSFSMGISTIVLMENMPAVVLSVILGTIIGILLRLNERIRKGGAAMNKIISRSNSKEMGSDDMNELITIIVLFCASGTGIYGSIVAGMSGDHSILLAKSILDLFTATIFACTLGKVVSIIAIPQAIIFLALFYGASLIYPLTTPMMLNDFKACGGILILAAGFNLTKIRQFPTADMLPALVLVMPLSHLWSTYVIPLVS